MYWFRQGSPMGFLPWLIVTLFWSVGGWLIATHAFNTEKKERLLIGFGLGLVTYLWLVNLIGRWLEPAAAFFIPGLVVFGAGLACSWRSKTRFLDFNDFSVYPILILFLVIFGYSVLLERGLGIFDDYHHLPAISVIGAGSLPPRYFLNANFDFSYHYGFELLGASLMRLGNMFSWSAFDVAKALVWAYSIVLVYLFLNRYLDKLWKVILGTITFVLMGGSRFLMMLLPSNILRIFDATTGFEGVSQNMGMPFSQALFSPWTIGGGPPTPYTFGFVNGINSPYIMSHGGEWSVALIIMILLWLLSTRISSPKAIPVIVVLMAHLALTFESSYGLLMVVLVVVAIYFKIERVSFDAKPFWYLVVAAGISIPFAIFQGGTLFTIVQNVLFKTSAEQPAVIIHSASSSVFSLNWPPTIFSAHFGDLSLFSLPQLLVAVFEIGPILFFTPWITIWAVRKFKAGDWMPGVIIVSAWLGLVLSLFISYNLSERDITRFTKHAIAFWMLIFIVLLLSLKNELGRWGKWAAIVCAMIMAVGGVVNGITQQSAIANPILSDGIDGLDAIVSAELWGKLPQNDIIFDHSSNEWRATALTGLLTVAGMNRDTTPTWKELSRNPSLEGFVDNNFRYLYVDQGWWRSLNDLQRASLSNPCIKVVAEASEDDYFRFRILLDLSQCSFMK